MTEAVDAKKSIAGKEDKALAKIELSKIKTDSEGEE